MDEDSEFREMVMKKLESSGFMQKMRAELRANIYHHLSDMPVPADKSNSQDFSESQNTTEITVKPEIAPASEDMALFLVQDLFDCLNLNYTSSVFKMESGFKSNRTRSEISKVLKVFIADGKEEETYIAETTNSDIVEESIAGQNIVKNAKPKPLLMEVLRAYMTSSGLAGSPSKLSETTSNADEYDEQTFITMSAQNTSANQTSESL